MTTFWDFDLLAKHSSKLDVLYPPCYRVREKGAVFGAVMNTLGVMLCYIESWLLICNSSTVT